jgi:long-chain acyl-CoA synthetase
MGFRVRFATLLREAPADADAVEFDEVWWSWGRIQELSRAFDDLLLEHGAGPGTRVGLVLENRPEHTAVIASLLGADRCLVTLSPLQPAERLASDLERSAVPVMVASSEVLGRPGVLTAGAAHGLVLELGADGSVTVVGGAVPAEPSTAPGVAIEMLTSGTTGPPKRVSLTDVQVDMALRNSGQVPREGALLATGTGLASTPLVHIGGIWAIIASWNVGRRVTMLPRFTLDGWVRAVETYRLRSAGLVPAALRTVYDADLPRERLASLQVIMSGTAPCPPELATAFFERYGARVCTTYGATEFAGAVAGWTLPLHEEWWDRKGGSSGRAFPGVQLRVVDESGAELGVEASGRLEIRSSQIDPDNWVRTSDLARLDADGFLWIEGRADDAIIRGGFKVHPDQVRKVLELHPAVREAAVAGLPDARLGQVPVAAVEREPGQPAPTPEELKALAKEHLTPYEVPAHILVLDELPRTPSSKVSRVDLLDLVRASLLGVGAT